MNIFSKLKDKIVEYIDVNIRLLKINLIEQISRIFGYFIYIIIILFILLAVLLFAGFGMAELFTQLVNSRWLGYSITFVIYFFMLWIFIARRRKIVKKISNAFIRVVTEPDEDENNL
jgi:hypothetical protein